MRRRNITRKVVINSIISIHRPRAEILNILEDAHFFLKIIENYEYSPQKIYTVCLQYQRVQEPLNGPSDIEAHRTSELKCLKTFHPQANPSSKFTDWKTDTQRRLAPSKCSHSETELRPEARPIRTPLFLLSSPPLQDPAMQIFTLVFSLIFNCASS